MSCPRSYPEHRPTITVEYSASTLSRWGFFPVILQYLRRLELPQRLQTVTVPSAPNAHFKPLDKLMTLVTLFLTGIARISHINPATILIRDHEDLVVSGGTPIVTGSGAIPCQA